MSKKPFKKPTGTNKQRNSVVRTRKNMDVEILDNPSQKESAWQQIDDDWQQMSKKDWDKAFDDDKDELDECDGCNIYYEILVRIKSILHNKDDDKTKVKRVQDLVYIARLL